MSILKIFKVIFVFIILFISVPQGYYVLNSKSPYISSTPPGCGVGVYVINLDSSKERYNYIKNNINKLEFDIKRISAVDGNKLSKKQVDLWLDKESYKQHLGHLPKLGTIGCSLSHIETWNDFL
ncbi:MAG: hypothetical protein DGJ47_001194, partial [Rickettsiaceae bacterium]